jgi:hypothetical protein
MVIPYNRLAITVEKVISYPEKGKRRKGQGADIVTEWMPNHLQKISAPFEQ